MHLKSTHILQAQVAMYSDLQQEGMFPGRQEALLDHLVTDNLFELPKTATTYPRTVAKREFVNDECVTLKARGDAEPLFVPNEYIAMLRQYDHRVNIETLSRFLQNYSVFEEQIENLQLSGNPQAASKHPNFLANGGSMLAYRFQASLNSELGDDFVGLFHAGGKKSVVLGRALALTLSDGIEGFEQGVALSLEKPIIISHFAQGVNLYNLSYEARTRIPDEHWKILEESIRRGSDRGITIDFNTDNFLYNQSTGFTTIDFRTKPHWASLDNILSENMRGFFSLKDIVRKTLEIKKN